MISELETEIHYDDLITRINDCWKKACILWNLPVIDYKAMSSDALISTKTDYVKRLKAAFKNNAGSIDAPRLIRLCKLFDSAGSNSLKANYLVNIIAHNCTGILADYELVGLRFELESKTEDQTVDYRAFFESLDGQRKEIKKA